MADKARTEDMITDLGGELTLVVGPQEGAPLRLRVSAPLLTIASRYFASLLGPHFQEGNKAAAGKEVNIKEDHAAAFKTLCEILHMQYSLEQTTLLPIDLLSLAIVADKYDCVKAIQLSLNTLFEGAARYGTTLIQMCGLVNAAYLFDSPKLFKQFTGSIILQSQQALTDTQAARAQKDTGMPPIVWLMLENKRATARAKFHAELLQRMIVGCSGGIACKGSITLVTNQVNELRHAALIQENTSNVSLEVLLVRADKLQIVKSDSKATCHVGRHCAVLRAPTSETLRALVDGVKVSAEGLCLDCVKAGGKNSGQCRITHA